MSRWWPAVSTQEGARAALKAGSYGAMFSALLTAIGFALFLYGVSMATPIYGKNEKLVSTSSQLENISSGTGIAIEAMFLLYCAWRFRNGKGRYIGILAVIVMSLEMLNKLLMGMPNLGSFLMFSVILVALVNGVRGAWALPKFLINNDIAEVFE
jgi:hypothetical protein